MQMELAELTTELAERDRRIAELEKLYDGTLHEHGVAESERAAIMAAHIESAGHEENHLLRIAELEATLAEREHELKSCRTELDEAREKVDLLMQPVPEVHGDFPWQMMRLWCSNYALEKRRWREDVAERERRIAELEQSLTRI